MTVLALALILHTFLCSAVPASKKDYFGEREIKRVIGSAPVTGLSQKEIDALVGIKIAYNDGISKSGHLQCKAPHYEEEIVSRNEFFALYFISPEKIGITSNAILMVRVEEKPGDLWLAPGSVFCVRDRDTLIAIHGGTCFEMHRSIKGQEKRILARFGLQLHRQNM